MGVWGASVRWCETRNPRGVGWSRLRETVKGCHCWGRMNFSNYNVYKVSNLDNLFADRYLA